MLVRQSGLMWILSVVLLLSLLAAGCTAHTAGQTPAPSSSASSAPTATATLPSGTASRPGVSPVASAIVSPTTASPTSPAALADKISQSVAAAASYSLERTIKTSKSAKSDKSDQANTTTISKTILDVSGRKMQMDNSVSVTQTGLTSALLENSIYIIDDTMYIRGMFPDNPQLWTKTAVNDNIWQMQNQARLVADLLQGQNITVLSPETVHSGNLDIPCDVLQVTPDLPKLWSLMAGQPGVQIPKTAPPGVAFSQFVKNAQTKVWAARSSGLPIKGELQISILIGPALVPALASDVTMDISLSMLFHDYNQATAVTLPDAAANAQELNLEPSQ